MPSGPKGSCGLNSERADAVAEPEINIPKRGK